MLNVDKYFFKKCIYYSKFNAITLPFKKRNIKLNMNHIFRKAYHQKSIFCFFLENDTILTCEPHIYEMLNFGKFLLIL